MATGSDIDSLWDDDMIIMIDDLIDEDDREHNDS